MLSYTQLKKGVIFVKNGDPYEVIDSEFSRLQKRKAVMQTTIRNLRTGKLYTESFRSSDEFEEAVIEKKPLNFLYQHRGEYFFAEPKDKSKRFSLSADAVGENAKWLKPRMEITALFFNDKFINLLLPIKAEFKVVDAPPGIQGNRAQSGTKAATIETGAVVQVPLFIKAGDIVRINTQSGEYIERTKSG